MPTTTTLDAGPRWERKVSVRLGSEYHEELERIAERRQTTVSALLREAAAALVRAG